MKSKLILCQVLSAAIGCVIGALLGGALGIVAGIVVAGGIGAAGVNSILRAESLYLQSLLLNQQPE